MEPCDFREKFPTAISDCGWDDLEAWIRAHFSLADIQRIFSSRRPLRVGELAGRLKGASGKVRPVMNFKR